MAEKEELIREFEKHAFRMAEGDINYLNDNKKHIRDLIKELGSQQEGKVAELMLSASSQIASMKKSGRWDENAGNNYDKFCEQIKRMIPKEAGYKIPDRNKAKEILKSKGIIKA
ncbi:MAG: hypothetical protein PHW96_01815 [Candidatus Nanoarchaeia archaeon]|nr:hypothetical protein [Candidatus Nanoarchaeia archaeon]